MADYIEREAAFNTILKIVPKVDDDGYCWVIRGDAAKAVDSIPSADVAPVRHGRLLNPNPYGECSSCGYLIDIRDSYNYCPNCGAKIDGGET